MQPFNLGLPDLFVRALALRSAAGATVLVAETSKAVFSNQSGAEQLDPPQCGPWDPSITALAVSGNLLFAGTRGSGYFVFDFADA